jgi:hypothetical protein
MFLIVQVRLGVLRPKSKLAFKGKFILGRRRPSLPSSVHIPRLEI